MNDLTTKVLIQIRDEIKATRDDLSTRLDATNSRLEIVARRQVESDVRVGSEIVGVRDAVERVVDLLRADRTLRHDMDDLKERVANLERKTG